MFFSSRRQKEQIESLQIELENAKKELQAKEISIEEERKILTEKIESMQSMVQNLELIHLYATLSKEISQSEQLRENQSLIIQLCEEMLEK